MIDSFQIPKLIQLTRTHLLVNSCKNPLAQ